MPPNVLVVVDDHAGDPAVARRETLLHQLFIRGRHSKINTLSSTQKYRVLAPQIRTQALSIFVFKLRSQQELDALLDEVSALAVASLSKAFTAWQPQDHTHTCTYAWASPSRSFSNGLTMSWSPSGA